MRIQMILDFPSSREMTEFYLRHVDNLSPCEVYVNELIPVDNYLDKNSKKKCEIILDHEPKIFKMMEDIEFYTLLRTEEDKISGETAVRRAWELNLGLSLSDARYLLDNQENIPMKVRGHGLNLYGTIMRMMYDDKGDTITIPQLVFVNGLWRLRNCWIGVDFTPHELVPSLIVK